MRRAVALMIFAAMLGALLLVASWWGGERQCRWIAHHGTAAQHAHYQC